MKEIQLSRHGKNKGKYAALVDDEDFDFLNLQSWYVSIEKSNIYARGIINKEKHTYLHNYIMKHKGVDHIDGNGLNNQKSNLRICTQRQNLMNQRPKRNSSSKYKGVSFNKKNKRWISNIMINGSPKYLGSFRFEIDAAKAYNEHAKKYFCQYAKLNTFTA